MFNKHILFLLDVTRQNSVEQATGETYLSELTSNYDSECPNDKLGGRMQSLQDVGEEEMGDDSTISRHNIILPPPPSEERELESIESVQEENAKEKWIRKGSGDGYAVLDLTRQHSVEQCTGDTLLSEVMSD